MKYQGNFFSLPNDIFILGLCPGELSVYSYLRRCEDQKTHQCWPSYKNIGSATGMSENTVSKYVQKLVDRGMIAAYLRENPGVTNKAKIARELHVSRPTVQRYYDEVRAEFQKME